MYNWRLHKDVESLLSKMELFEEQLQILEESVAKLKEQCYNIHTLLEKENGDGEMVQG